MFGDQTPSNIVWWPNMLMLKWVSKRLNMFHQTRIKQLIQAAQSKRGTHARIKHVWYAVVQTNKTSPIKHEYKRNVLSCCLNVWWSSNFIRHDQTRSNTHKHDQTHPTRSNSTKQGVQTVKCLFTKQCLMVFGHQTFIVCPGPESIQAQYLPK